MYSADPPPPPPTPAALVPVVAAKVEVADFPIVMMGIGSVVAYNVVDVRAQVTGTIVKIGFVEG
jgi:multidrug efflux system membrane fusion protein